MAQARPPLVQAAGILLIVGGALSVLGGLLLFGIAAIPGAAIFAVISLLLGAAQIYAGTQVMALKEQGRMLGLILAGIGALLALFQIFTGFPGAILGLLIDGFIIYALVTNQAAFHR